MALSTMVSMVRRTSIACGLLVAALAGRAGATSIQDPWEGLFSARGTVYSPSLSQAEQNEATRVPVDAVAWRLAACFEAVGERCALRAGEHVVPVAVEMTGKEACESVDDATFGRAVFFFLRRFRPDEPLMAGQRYQLTCEDSVEDGLVFVRASSAASAPPEELEIVGVERQDGPGCGGVAHLEVRFKSLSGTFLDEGGYVEVLSPRGEVAALRDLNPKVEIPLVDGVFRFTPVAANGERGEVVEVDADMVDGSCGVHPRGSPLAPWLVASLLWGGTRMRRRRR